MKITLLGTGTSMGVPMIGCRCPVCLSDDARDKRLRSSVLVEINDTTILIDVSPDFRQQALRTPIEKIDAILITHAHKDHIGGMDDIKPFNFISGKSIPVYAEPLVMNEIHNEFGYAFRSTPDSVPQIDLIEISHPNPFYINDIEILPIRLMHDSLPVLGFRIGDFAYLTDFSAIDESELSKLHNLELLVIVALRHKPHPKHLSFRQALDIVKQLNPRKARLTHISHTLGKHVEIVMQCPENVLPGFDNEMLIS